MKKKFLAVALSCATMAMLVMPSAFATSANGGTSGEITDSSGIVLTGSGTFSFPSVTSISLTTAKSKCYYTATTAQSLNRYFTVTDTDTSATHTITIDGESDADGSDDGSLTKTSNGANATAMGIGTVKVSLEAVGDADCGSPATDTKTQIFYVSAGNGTAADIALSNGWVTGSTQTWLALTGSGQTLLTGTPTAPIQYQFAPRSFKITYPADGKANTYTTTLVFAYNAS